MLVPKHSHHSMVGASVDLSRESCPAGPRDTHEPMVQIRGATVESNHIGHLSTKRLSTAPLPIGDEEDAGNSRQLRRPLPNSRMDNPVPLLQLAATFAFSIALALTLADPLALIGAWRKTVLLSGAKGVSRKVRTSCLGNPAIAIAAPA